MEGGSVTRILPFPELGLELHVERLRWRVVVISGCADDVRQALSGVESFGKDAPSPEEALARGMMIVGHIRGFILARRNPETLSLFAAEHANTERQRVRVALAAAVQAYDAGRDEAAKLILATTLRSLRPAGPHEADAARKLADWGVAEVRRRGLDRRQSG